MVCSQQKDIKNLIIRVELNLSKRHCTGRDRVGGRTRPRTSASSACAGKHSQWEWSYPKITPNVQELLRPFGPMMSVSVETPSINLFTEMINEKKKKKKGKTKQNRVHSTYWYSSDVKWWLIWMVELSEISGYRMRHKFVLACVSLGCVRHCRLR